MNQFLIATIAMGGLGAFFGAVLVIANARLKVEEDARVEAITAVLPGSNCGACGHPGCRHFAEAIVAGEQEPTGCAPGGQDAASGIGAILGIDVDEVVASKARVVCLGDNEAAANRAVYQGIEDCYAAALVGSGGKGCVYGCLGFGSCVRACPFDAMIMADNGLPVIDDAKCTGCGLCVPACPRNLMRLVPESTKIVVACASPEQAKAVREVCKRGCITCLLCAKVCPRDAITFENNLPVIDQERCDGCGLCIDKCAPDCLLESFPGMIQRRPPEERRVRRLEPADDGEHRHDAEPAAESREIRAEGVE